MTRGALLALAGAVLLAALSACQPAGAPAAADGPDPQALCISPDCGSKEVLVPLPEAENLLFSDDGRLFVSGDRLYEIVQGEGGGFEARPVPMDSGASGSLGGLAIANGVLYMNDETNRGLWAARLQPEMQLRQIYTYRGGATPNGLALGPDGALYSSRGPMPDLTSLDSLVRIQLDPNDPFKVVAEEKIFGIPEVPAANGIVLAGATFYTVGYLVPPPQLSSVFAFDVGADGTIGPLRTLLSYPGTFDDLEIVGDRLLIANNFANEVLMFDLQGRLLANSGPIFAGPTAITYGRPPMFAPTDLLVAERGIIGESGSGVGDDLAVFRRRAP